MAKQKQAQVSRVLEHVGYVYEWFANPARSRRKVALPTILNLPITDNCNSRCVMCDVWKEPSVGEISPEDLRKILSDRLFRRIQHVGISGGEPTLRADLVEIVRVVVSTLPRLRSLSITSHGFHTKRWEKILPVIKNICDSCGVKFTLNLSIDGVGSVHDKVRRIPNGFEKLMKTYELARSLGVNVELQSTILSRNVYHVGCILQHAKDLGAKVIFRQATEIARLSNRESVASVVLDKNEKSFFADFLESDILLEATPSPARRLFYRDLAQRLSTDQPRRAPCAFQREGVVLTAHGDLYHCSISTEPMGNALVESPYEMYFSERSEKIRQNLIWYKCPTCVHDQSGAWSPLELVGEVLGHTKVSKRLRIGFDGLTVLAKIPLLAYKHRKALRAKQKRKSGEENASSSLRKGSSRTAVIIGAYGGEHVGDAAILGGVILRLHREYGVSVVHIASTRPHRTRRWVDSLELPVDVNVFPYELKKAQEILKESTYLVYGGGPLMDLPKLLTKHVELASWATRVGKGFIIEGVGIGPFKLLVSQWMVKWLLSLADAVSVRTTRSSRSSLLHGSSVRITKDPAFDYLETRKQLNRLSPSEQESLDEILGDLEGKLVVGINLRPLWHKYARSMTEDQVRRIEEEFMVKFAESLTLFSERNDGMVTYIFFPMNSDQFGFSDLLAAYKLRKLIPDRVDFRIWEMEPGVDAVLYLLRHLDAAITMRFHASIFSLSQGVPTIAIDYSLGEQGKVGELFEDNGMAERVIRIDRFEVQWLLDRLNSLLS